MNALQQLVKAWREVPQELRPVPGASLSQKQYWRFVHWLMDIWDEFGNRVLAELSIHQQQEAQQIRSFAERARKALAGCKTPFFAAFDEHLVGLLELDKREKLPRRGKKRFLPQQVRELLREDAPLRTHVNAAFEQWDARLAQLNASPHSRPLWEAVGADRSTGDGPGVRNARGLPAFMVDVGSTIRTTEVVGYCWAAAQAIHVASRIVVRSIFELGYGRILARQSVNPWVIAHCLDRVVRLRTNSRTKPADLSAAEEWFDTLNPLFLRWWPANVRPPLHGFPREAAKNIGVVPHMLDWLLSEREATSLPNVRVERYVLSAAFLLDQIAVCSNDVTSLDVAVILTGSLSKPVAQLSSGKFVTVTPAKADFLAQLSKTGFATGNASMVSNLKKDLQNAGVECDWTGNGKGLQGQQKKYSGPRWVAKVADFRE